ncbi:MAG TPA: hypothetical protein VF589_01515 [Allosphingosinicella sp.]|jgi:hypothetical protein
MISRPDGSTSLAIAWILFAASLLFALVAYSMDVTTYSGIDPGKVALQFALWVLAGALFQLWLVLWAVGSIVRALWFLPGELQKQPEAPQADRFAASPTPQEMEGQVCGWCDRRVREPGLPCSEATEEQRRAAFKAIQNPMCRARLQEHGYGEPAA